MNLQVISKFYILAGLYDGILGLAFLLVPGRIFAFYNVTPPNHMAYVQFSALLLMVFAIMFFRIAANPIRNREYIRYGCGLKVWYCVMAFGYEITEGIPSMWIPWAWFDLVFLLLFILTWRSLTKQAHMAEGA